MDEFQNRESQQELFSEFSGQPKNTERFPSLGRSQKPILITTNIEQIIVISLAGLLCICFFFFLGVLRGRTLKAESRTVLSAPSASSAPVAAQNATRTVPSSAAKTVQKLTVAAPPAAPAIPKKLAPAIFVQDPQKPYTIQLVTHKKKEYAENEVATFRRSGFYSFIIPSGDYYQVCVGQYASKEEAQKDLIKLKSRYHDCFLRRR